MATRIPAAPKTAKAKKPAAKRAPAKKPATKQLRGSSTEAERRAHNPEVARSTRAPATKTVEPKPLTPWQQWSANADAALNELCSYIVSGGHLNGFCREKAIPYTNILRWIDAEPSRAEMYARAREDRSDKLADEIVAISDDSFNDTYTDDEGNVKTNHEVVARAKLRVDARKWVAAKLKPRVYGEKLDLTQSVTFKDVPDDELLARAARLTALLGKSTCGGPADE